MLRGDVEVVVWTNHEVPRGIDTGRKGTKWGASEGVVLEEAITVGAGNNEHLLLTWWFVSRRESVELQATRLSWDMRELLDEAAVTGVVLEDTTSTREN